VIVPVTGCEHRWVDAKRCYDCGEVVSDDPGGGRRRETPEGDWAEEKARKVAMDVGGTYDMEPIAAALREAEERGTKKHWERLLTGEAAQKIKAQARSDAFREAADAMNTMMQQVWAKVDPISIESWKADWLRAKAEEPSTGLHPGSEQKDEVPF